MLGHLGAAFHSSHSPHVTCAEHGELLDVGRSIDAATDAHDEQGWRASPATVAGHEHEHCVLASFAQSFATGGAAPAALSTPVPVAADSLAPCDEPRASAVAVYRVAPKCSPPA
jgi:hypothetical protein